MEYEEHIPTGQPEPAPPDPLTRQRPADSDFGQPNEGLGQDLAQDPGGGTLGGIGGTASGGQVDADEDLWQGEQPPDEKDLFGAP